MTDSISDSDFVNSLSQADYDKIVDHFCEIEDWICVYHRDNYFWGYDAKNIFSAERLTKEEILFIIL